MLRRSLAFGSALALLCMSGLAQAFTETCLTLAAYDHASPEWSPDGTQIVYSRKDETGQYHIYRMGSDGANPVKVSSLPYDHYLPQWSPDGQWIACEVQWTDANREIYKLPVSSGSPFALTVSAYDHFDPQWSPDGQWVAYSRMDSTGKRQIYKVNALSPSPTESALTSSDYHHDNPQWNSDGSHLAYQKLLGYGGTRLCTLYVESMSEKDVTSSSIYLSHFVPQWSPDYGYIVSQVFASGQYQLSSIRNYGDGAEVLLTSDDYEHKRPQWSPDGRWIAYEKVDATGYSQITMTPRIGGTEVALTSTLSQHTVPQWSPNSDEIVYVREFYPGLNLIWKVSGLSSASAGWAKATSQAELTGLLLYGDKIDHGIAGLPAATTPAMDQTLCHFHTSDRWYTGISVANPSATSVAHITMTAYGDSGSVLGQAAQTLAPNGKVSGLVSALFAINNATGWIEVNSDVPVVAFCIYGDKISGGLAALSSAPASQHLALPHFQCSSRWWTGISVANPNDSNVAVTVTAYGDTGEKLGWTIVEIPAKGKKSALVDALLPVAGKTGWLKVDAVFIPPSSPVCAVVIYGDRVALPNEIAAVVGGEGSSPLRFAHFASDTDYWTGLAFVNLDSTATANLWLGAWGADGDIVATKSLSLGPLNRSVGFVSSLFSLSSATEGWIEVSSSEPVVGLQLIHGDTPNMKGLAGISSQDAATEITMPHYDSGSRWWTLFSIANVSETEIVAPNVLGYSSEGVLTGVNLERYLMHKEKWTQVVSDLFGIEP